MVMVFITIVCHIVTSCEAAIEKRNKGQLQWAMNDKEQSRTHEVKSKVQSREYKKRGGNVYYMPIQENMK